jgi:TRAP-type uncharacterized transport system substrate-binding protein
VKRFFWTIGALVVFLAASPLRAEERFHFFASLGAGPTNGVYYPVGWAICAIVNEDLRLAPRSSGSARYFFTSGQAESASDPKASSPDIVLTSL